MRIDKINKCDYTVVYDTSVPALAYAAEQLNLYFLKACGFTLSENAKAKHKIFLGREIGGLDNSCLKSDGFRLLFKNGDLYVIGNSEVAVIYGVYEIIERFLGVKWINRDCTYIPKKSAFEAEETEAIKVPCFEQRVFLSGLAYEPEIASHLRFNFPEPTLYAHHRVKKAWCDKVPDPHNSWCYIDKEKYEKEHPEFFCKNAMGTTEFCYSNGLTDDFEIDTSKKISVLSLVTDTMYRLVKENPDSKFFMYGRQDDSTAICHCPVCERRRAQLGGEGGIMVAFLNAVIKGVEQRLAAENVESDFCVATLAYQMTVDPPVKDGKPLHKNAIPSPRLHIRYAPIGADYTYSFLDERQKADVRFQIFGWAALTSNVMLWDYQCNYHDYCWYFPNLYYLKENLALYAKIGMSYVLNQGAYNTKVDWQGEMKSYICSRLYWDMSLDVNELMHEYVTCYYGIVAPKILDYINQLENFYKQKIADGFKVSIFNGDDEYFAAKSYPQKWLEGHVALLDSALQDVKDSNLPEDEKNALTMRINKVLLTPIRMLMRNADVYYKGGNDEYEKRFFKLANECGMVKLGEGLPVFIEMQNGGASEYKIVLGQEFTAREKAAAEYVQRKFFDLSGSTLPIVTDDKVYPTFGEKAVCIGEHMMFREFFKGHVHEKDYEYYVETRGKCMFIAGAGDLTRAADVLFEDIIVSDGENGKILKLPFAKKCKAI